MSDKIHTLARVDNKYYAFSGDVSVTFSGAGDIDYHRYDEEINHDGAYLYRGWVGPKPNPLRYYDGYLTYNGVEVYSSQFAGTPVDYAATKQLFQVSWDVTSEINPELDPSLYRLFIRGQNTFGTEISHYIECLSENTVRVRNSYDSTWYTKTVTYGEFLELVGGMRVKFNDLHELIGTTWTIDVANLYVGSRKLQHETIDDSLFICSEIFPLHQITGNTAHQMSDGYLDVQDGVTYTKPDLKSRVLALYNDFVLLANGKTLFWSSRREGANWRPSRTNSSDLINFHWENYDIMGLFVLGETAYVSFPTSTYSINLVGKPTIMQRRMVLDGVGVNAPHSVEVVKGSVFFLGLDSFYVFNGGAPDAIGGEIWEQFYANIDKNKLHDTWSFHNVLTQQVGWVNNGLAYLFNYREKHWTIHNASEIYSHLTRFETATPNFNEVGETFNNYEGVFKNFSTPLLENIWGGSKRILEDANEGETVDCVDTIAPYLETHDIFYNEIHTDKIIDYLVIDAEYDADCLGIDIMVSTRDFTTQPVVYKTVKRWTQDDQKKRVTFQGERGKVFRFKLVPVGSTNGMRNLTFYAWGERILLSNTPETKS